MSNGMPPFSTRYDYNLLRNDPFLTEMRNVTKFCQQCGILVISQKSSKLKITLSFSFPFVDVIFCGNLDVNLRNCNKEGYGTERKDDREGREEGREGEYQSMSVHTLDTYTYQSREMKDKSLFV